MNQPITKPQDRLVSLVFTTLIDHLKQAAETGRHSDSNRLAHIETFKLVRGHGAGDKFYNEPIEMTVWDEMDGRKTRRASNFHEFVEVLVKIALHSEEFEEELHRRLIEHDLKKPQAYRKP